VLGQCRPWQEAVQVVLLHVPEGASTEHDIAAALSESKQAMKDIPGVREIRIQQAPARDGRYQYCFLVTLSCPSAIEPFRNHHAQRLLDKATLSNDSSVLVQEFAEI
jgi:hypothetical protein